MVQKDDSEISTCFAKLTMALENAAGVASEGQQNGLEHELLKELIEELDEALARAKAHLEWLRRHFA